MKICFIGTGYVGLVSGVLFSDFGNIVYCVDNNKKKTSDLNFLENETQKEIQDLKKITLSKESKQPIKLKNVFFSMLTFFFMKVLHSSKSQFFNNQVISSEIEMFSIKFLTGNVFKDSLKLYL